MTAHRIKYQGPPTLALETATLLADADGIELTSSAPPERPTDDGSVVLTMTVEGDIDDVLDAVGRLRGELPPGATLQVVA